MQAPAKNPASSRGSKRRSLYILAAILLLAYPIFPISPATATSASCFDRPASAGAPGYYLGAYANTTADRYVWDLQPAPAGKDYSTPPATNATAPAPRTSDEYTGSSERHCAAGKCNLVVYSGTRFVEENGKWARIEDARSLKDAGFSAAYLENDSDFTLDLYDFNYTTKTICTGASDLQKNKDIPLRTWRAKDAKETTGDFKKDHYKSSEMTRRFRGSGDVQCETIPSGLGDIVEFGFNSTTIQLRAPDTENIADTYVRLLNPNTNYGTDTILTVLYDWINIYIRFNNMTSIPAGSTINDAQLYLYFYTTDSSTGNVSLYYVNDTSWNGQNETTLTWNNQPCGAGFNDSSRCNLTAESKVIIDTAAGNIWYNWTATQAVARAYNSGHSNVSFVLANRENGSVSSSAYSKESGFANKPYLNITYTEAADIISPSVTMQAPANTTYASSSVALNYTAGDAGGLSSCVYELDGSNTTIAGCQNTTLNSLGWGGHSVKVWVNDSAGNWNVSATVWFTVNFCGTLSDANRTYVLGTGLNSSGTCITIGADNITINGNGYLINYSRATSGSAYYAIDNQGGWDFITLKNLNIVQGTARFNSYAVYFSGSTNGTIANNTINTTGASSWGVLLSTSSDNNLVSGNRFLIKGSNGYGVRIAASSYNTIRGNTFNSTDTSAGENFRLFGGDYNTIANNTMYGFTGIRMSAAGTGNVMSNNTVTITAQWGEGVDTMGENGTIENNVITTAEYGTYGIYLKAGGNNVTNNRISLTGTDSEGITIESSNNRLTNNTIEMGPTSKGLYLRTSADTVSNNVITGGSVAVDPTGYDYYLLDAGDSNNFTQTNFTGPRILYFGDSVANSYFNYNNQTGGNIWLRAGFSTITTAAITRTLVNWNSTLMVWNDSATATVAYNLSGLLAMASYSVYNSSTLLYALTTDSAAVLPGFEIGLNGQTEIRIVNEDITPPSITIQSPQNTTYPAAPIPLNFTAYDFSGASSCRYELSNSSGAYNLTLPNCQNSTLAGVTEGPNSIRVWANDTANNWNVSATTYFTSDTRAPAVSMLFPQNGYNSTTQLVALNVSAIDALSALLNCSVFVDGSTIWADANWPNGTTIQNATSQTEGTRNLSATCRDSAGNANTTNVYFTIDLTPPAILSANTTPPRAYNGTNITIFATATDGQTSVVSITANITHPSLATEQISLSLSGSVWSNSTFVGEIGAYFVTLNATDAVGRTSASQFSFLSSENTTVNYTLTNSTGGAISGIVISIIAPENNGTIHSSNAANSTLTTPSGVVTIRIDDTSKNITIDLPVNVSGSMAFSPVIQQENETAVVSPPAYNTPLLVQTITPNVTLYANATLKFNYSSRNIPASEAYRLRVNKCTTYNSSSATCSGSWAELNTSVNNVTQIVTATVDSFSTFMLANRTSVCGNSVQETGEACDAGPSGSSSCTATCTAITQSTPPSGGSTPSASSAPVTRAAAKETAYIANMEPGIPATMLFSKAELPVYQITLETTAKATNVSVTAEKLDAKPTAITANPTSTGKTYKYLDLSSGIPAASLSRAKIRFKVEFSWITANNYSTSTVYLNRYSSGWARLPTAYLKSDATYAYFEAESPGLSTFAITGEKPAPIPAPEPPAPPKEEPAPIQPPPIGPMVTQADIEETIAYLNSITPKSETATKLLEAASLKIISAQSALNSKEQELAKQLLEDASRLIQQAATETRPATVSRSKDTLLTLLLMATVLIIGAYAYQTTIQTNDYEKELAKLKAEVNVLANMKKMADEGHLTGKIETKIYNIMLSEYDRRLIDLKERIAKMEREAKNA